MEQIIIPNDIFFENLIDELKTSGSVLLCVKGCSMFPFFRDGKDSALLVPFDRAAGLKRGDMALFRFRGRWIMHRCTGIVQSGAEGRPGGGETVYMFRGDGNPSGRETAAESDVYAVVTKRIAPSGKEWRCGSFSWRLCSALWPRTYLVRRVLLGVLRRI